MKESEIRNRETHKRYLELVRADSDRIFDDKSKFVHFPCPACGGGDIKLLFEKDNFQYVQCSGCGTIYNDPRPQYRDLQRLYKESESTRFWVREFFTPFVDARRAKIFKPRADYIASRFSHLRMGEIGDVGAGFGLFLEELGKVWNEAKLYAIEPSDDMARICESKGLTVIESMVEDVDPKNKLFDLLTSFELVEHLYDPMAFFLKIRTLLKDGGVFYFTTLNGLGFDIQVLWEKSRSIAPPHHLNFFNPASITVLLNRAGFETIEVSTPGKLDWDIVENAARAENTDIGRFFETVKNLGTDDAKRKLQEWISHYDFSSHMQVVAKKA